jgi:flavin reductase (DIM6/NTAB) family NADH-FMN oxidoreductase RutF/DNA-binding GntR family transcriptional regulator
MSTSVGRPEQAAEGSAQADSGAQAPLRRLTPEEFRDVIGHFASGVTVITAMHDGERRGTTASAVSSLSLEPPMVLICLNKTSATARAVAAARRFAVNILGEDQAEEAMRFAKRADAGDKFAGIAVSAGDQGEPLLANALATLECHVAEQVTGGTHLVFLAEVERASARTGSPLAYFRGQFGRLELAQDENAFLDVRARVLSRELEVGLPLGLDELATRLRLLRGPVYHALTRLTGEGLVTRDAQGAFVITPLTLTAVEEAWRARCAIELGVAALTVGKASAERIAELRRLADAARPAPPEEYRMDNWVKTYNAFHEGMVSLADSGPLLDAYRRVNAPAMILSLTQNRMEELGLDREQSETAHEHIAQVVAGYQSSNLDATTEAIIRHTEFASEVARRFMDAQGGSI